MVMDLMNSETVSKPTHKIVNGFYGYKAITTINFILTGNLKQLWFLYWCLASAVQEAYFCTKDPSYHLQIAFNPFLFAEIKHLDEINLRKEWFVSTQNSRFSKHIMVEKSRKQAGTLYVQPQRQSTERMHHSFSPPLDSP